MPFNIERCRHGVNDEEKSGTMLILHKYYTEPMDRDKPVFNQIEEKLGSLPGQPGVAESHGALCGLLCSSDDLSGGDWLQRVFPDVSPDTETVTVFSQLCAKTKSDLSDSCFAFSPLLPDDDQSIDRRIEALGEWCQGFMLGLSLGGLQQTEQLSSEAQEILRDLAEMSQAGSYQLEGDEQDERSYVELVEYLRTGVLLLHAELGCRKQSVSPTKLH